MAKVIRVESKEEVWREYLALTNALQEWDNQLSPKELELMAYLCTLDPDKDHLQGMGVKRVMGRFPGRNRNLIAAEKFRLKKKGWLVDEGKQSFINGGLRKILKKLWGMEGEMELRLEFIITNKGI